MLRIAEMRRRQRQRRRHEPPRVEAPPERLARDRHDGAHEHVDRRVRELEDRRMLDEPHSELLEREIAGQIDQHLERLDDLHRQTMADEPNEFGSPQELFEPESADTAMPATGRDSSAQLLVRHLQMIRRAASVLPFLDEPIDDDFVDQLPTPVTEVAGAREPEPASPAIGFQGEEELASDFVEDTDRQPEAVPTDREAEPDRGDPPSPSPAAFEGTRSDGERAPAAGLGLDALQQELASALDEQAEAEDTLDGVDLGPARPSVAEPAEDTASTDAEPVPEPTDPGPGPTDTVEEEPAPEPAVTAGIDLGTLQHELASALDEQAEAEDTLDGVDLGPARPAVAEPIEDTPSADAESVPEPAPADVTDEEPAPEPAATAGIDLGTLQHELASALDEQAEAEDASDSVDPGVARPAVAEPPPESGDPEPSPAEAVETEPERGPPASNETTEPEGGNLAGLAETLAAEMSNLDDSNESPVLADDGDTPANGALDGPAASVAPASPPGPAGAVPDAAGSPDDARQEEAALLASLGVDPAEMNAASSGQAAASKGDSDRTQQEGLDIAFGEDDPAPGTASGGAMARVLDLVDRPFRRMSVGTKQVLGVLGVVMAIVSLGLMVMKFLGWN